MFPLGWQHYLAGGLLIGVGVSLIYIYTGIMAGASTFFSSTWSYFSKLPYFKQARFREERGWRSLFALSMVIGAIIYTLFNEVFVTEVQWWRLLLGGFLVGFGTRMSRGCTSGHGICGVGSLSRPSIVAVVTFLVVAVFTAMVVQALGVVP